MKLQYSKQSFDGYLVHVIINMIKPKFDNARAPEVDTLIVIELSELDYLVCHVDDKATKSLNDIRCC